MAMVNTLQSNSNSAEQKCPFLEGAPQLFFGAVWDREQEEPRAMGVPRQSQERFWHQPVDLAGKASREKVWSKSPRTSCLGMVLVAFLAVTDKKQNQATTKISCCKHLAGVWVL